MVAGDASRPGSHHPRLDRLGNHRGNRARADPNITGGAPSPGLDLQEPKGRLTGKLGPEKRQRYVINRHAAGGSPFQTSVMSVPVKNGRQGKAIERLFEAARTHERIYL